MTIRFPLAYILLTALPTLGCDPSDPTPADAGGSMNDGPTCEEPLGIGPFSCTGVECATTDEEVELLTVLQEEIDRREAGERLQIVALELEHDQYLVQFRYHDDWFENYESSYFDFGTDYAIPDPPTRWRAVFGEIFADAPAVRALPELLDTLAQCDPDIVFDHCNDVSSYEGPKIFVPQDGSCGAPRAEIDAVTGELIHCNEEDPDACSGMTG